MEEAETKRNKQQVTEMEKAKEEEADSTHSKQKIEANEMEE